MLSLAYTRDDTGAAIPMNKLHTFVNDNYKGPTQAFLGISERSVTVASPIHFFQTIDGIPVVERAKGSALPRLPGSTAYVVKTEHCNGSYAMLFQQLLETANLLQLIRWIREPLASQCRGGIPCL